MRPIEVAHEHNNNLLTISIFDFEFAFKVSQIFDIYLLSTNFNAYKTIKKKEAHIFFRSFSSFIYV